MGSVNARFQLGASLAIAAMLLILLPLVAMAATLDEAAIAAAEKADDKGKPRKPPVFSPDRSNREVEALKAEVQKLRAEADMCRGAKAAK
jgi:hypothetical protein